VYCNAYPLQNPSFDYELESWAWTNPAGDASASASVNSRFGHHDNISVQLICNNMDSTPNTSTTATVLLSQNISTCAAATYSVSFWYMQNSVADSDTNTVETQLSLTVDGISLVAHRGGDPDGLGNSPLGEWFLISDMSFIASTDTSLVQFELACNSSNQLNVTIDNINLVAVDASGVAPSTSTELLFNGYFAEGFTGWHYGESGNDHLVNTYTYYDGQPRDNIAWSYVYDDSPQEGINGGYVTLACEAQGYAFISQEVNTEVGATYAFSFSYSNLQFGQPNYVDGVEAQIQVLLDGHIVSAFAALTNDWQASTIVLVATLSYSLVEVRLFCPAQEDDKGIEDDSAFPSIFEAGVAQFSLSVTNASVTTSPLVPEDLLGTEDLI